MRNSLKEWCSTADIGIGLIDLRTGDYITMNPNASLDDVYVVMSLDLYSEIQKQSMAISRQYPVQAAATPTVMSFHLTTGSFTIKAIPRYRNFLFIGTLDDLKQYEYNGVDPIFLSTEERRRVDREFEDIILNS